MRHARVVAAKTSARHVYPSCPHSMLSDAIGSCSIGRKHGSDANRTHRGGYRDAGWKALCGPAAEVRAQIRCLVCMSIRSPARAIAHATPSASLDCRTATDFARSNHSSFWYGHTAPDPDSSRRPSSVYGGLSSTLAGGDVDMRDNI